MKPESATFGFSDKVDALGSDLVQKQMNVICFATEFEHFAAKSGRDLACHALECDHHLGGDAVPSVLRHQDEVIVQAVRRMK